MLELALCVMFYDPCPQFRAEGLTPEIAWERWHETRRQIRWLEKNHWRWRGGFEWEWDRAMKHAERTLAVYDALTDAWPQSGFVNPMRQDAGAARLKGLLGDEAYNRGLIPHTMLQGIPND